jgi:hypothetical protein
MNRMTSKRKINTFVLHLYYIYYVCITVNERLQFVLAEWNLHHHHDWHHRRWLWGVLGVPAKISLLENQVVLWWRRLYA